MAMNVELRLTLIAHEHLLGKTIVAIRYLTQEEADGLGWHEKSLVRVLDDGTYIFPSQDDEGNGAGVLFGATADDGHLTFPTVRGGQ